MCVLYKKKQLNAPPPKKKHKIKKQNKRNVQIITPIWESQITHVIRGEEWINSAPKHLLLYEYFGWEAPTLVGGGGFSSGSGYRHWVGHPVGYHGVWRSDGHDNGGWLAERQAGMQTDGQAGRQEYGQAGRHARVARLAS